MYFPDATFESGIFFCYENLFIQNMLLSFTKTTLQSKSDYNCSKTQFKCHTRQEEGTHTQIHTDLILRDT